MPACHLPHRSRSVRQTRMSVLPFRASLQFSCADAFRPLTFWKSNDLWTNGFPSIASQRTEVGVNWKSTDLLTNGSTVSRKPANGSGANWKSSDLLTNGSIVPRKPTNRSGPNWKSNDLLTNSPRAEFRRLSQLVAARFVAPVSKTQNRDCNHLRIASLAITTTRGSFAGNADSPSLLQEGQAVR
jgi:hypothetical protein